MMNCNRLFNYFFCRPQNTSIEDDNLQNEDKPIDLDEVSSKITLNNPNETIVLNDTFNIESTQNEFVEQKDNETEFVEQKDNETELFDQTNFALELSIKTNLITLNEIQVDTPVSNESDFLQEVSSESVIAEESFEYTEFIDQRKRQESNEYISIE